MYVPASFAPDDDAVAELLANIGAADLVTATPQGLVATTLPMVHDPATNVLRGHLAQENDQWRADVLGEAMVIVRGPDSYVSPSWYPSKVQHGRVVPTWNHVTAHVYGTLSVHEDAGWLAAHVREITDRHEADRERPWSVDDPPEGFVDGMLRGIVGVQVAITRVEASFKLSQNRSAGDVDGVIAGLAADGDEAGADAVATHRRR